MSSSRAGQMADLADSWVQRPDQCGAEPAPTPGQAGSGAAAAAAAMDDDDDDDEDEAGWPPLAEVHEEDSEGEEDPPPAAAAEEDPPPPAAAPTKRTHPQAICGLTKHIAELTGALKQANGALMTCQTVLMDERDTHGKELALLRARLAAGRARHAHELRMMHTKLGTAEHTKVQAAQLSEGFQERTVKLAAALDDAQREKEVHAEQLAKAVATERLAVRRSESLEALLNDREAEHGRAVRRMTELQQQVMETERTLLHRDSRSRDAATNTAPTTVPTADAATATQPVCCTDAACDAIRAPTADMGTGTSPSTADAVTETSAALPVDLEALEARQRKSQSGLGLKTRSLNKQTRMVRSRLRTVCAAAAAAEDVHQKTAKQLRQREQELAQLKKELAKPAVPDGRALVDATRLVAMSQACQVRPCRSSFLELLCKFKLDLLLGLQRVAWFVG